MINIWGQPGCLRPDGNLCTACCTYKAILSRWGKKTFVKNPNTNCNLQVIGRGCQVNGMAPDACENYHCSQAGAAEQETLRQTELINFPMQ